MTGSHALRTALLCAVVVTGCSRDDGGQKTGTKAREMTTAEVMDLVIRATYQPPANGQLTEEQVRVYLEVKRRAQEIRAAEPASQEPGATADLRAALELGHNPKELTWVQERVLEAWMVLRGQELDRKIDESRSRMIRELEEQVRNATEARQKRELEQQIAEIRAAAPLSTEAASSVGHNAALVRRHESDVAGALAEEGGPQEARDGR